MTDLTALRYSEEHEWVAVSGDATAGDPATATIV